MEGSRWSRIRTLRIALIVVMIGVLLVAAAIPRLPVHAAPQHPYVFYLVPGLSNDAFYVTMQSGAQQAARTLGAKLVYQGSPYAFSPSAQIPYLDAAIAQHPDAIIIAPTDRRALIRPIRRAVRAGIPVITVDTFIDAPVALTNIASRNRHGGQLAAMALATAIRQRGTVASIGVQPGISTTDQREQGFAQQMRSYANIRYLGTRYDYDVQPEAMSITAHLLNRYSGLNGIFAMNVLSGDGAIAALQAAHRQSQVKLVEFDAGPLQVQALRQGLVEALVAQDPWTMGATAVQLADKWVTGHRQGIKKQYYTREVILTRQNIDNPALKRFLYTGG